MKQAKELLRKTPAIGLYRAIRRMKSVIEETYIARNISPDIFKIFRFISENPGSAAYTGTPREFTFGNIKFSAKKENWYGVREVLINHEYAFLQHVVGERKKPLILDLGANIGAFAIFAFGLYDDAEIHSFEPAATTYALLKKNQESNPSLNWTTHQAAVWNKDAVLEFEISAYSTGSKVSADCGAGCEKVKAIGLDTILETIASGKIVLLKMDIEGAEEKVVCEHAALIKEKVENFIIEVHPRECDARRVVATLRNIYEEIYEVSGRKSKWPLLLATNKKLPLKKYMSSETVSADSTNNPSSPKDEQSAFPRLFMS